jgi:hypothetical protein
VHGLAVDVVDAMLGHTRGGVADSYGEFPPEAMLAELAKIPDIMKSFGLRAEPSEAAIGAASIHEGGVWSLSVR